MSPELINDASGRGRHVQWRERCLREAGFEPSLAARLACDTGSDLHALLELVDRGCPPALAARITAPLDREGPAR